MAEFINTVDVIGDDAVADGILNRSIVEYNDDRVTSIGPLALTLCTELTSVDFPMVTTIGNNAFDGCTNLTNVNFPNAHTVGTTAFNGCSVLSNVCFPALKQVPATAFQTCTELATADFAVANDFRKDSFKNCYKLTGLIIRNIDGVAYSYGGILSGTPIASGTGYIYVPAALVSDYKSNTGWSKYANQFRALEDYTVDGTTTGELDPTKI